MHYTGIDLACAWTRVHHVIFWSSDRVYTYYSGMYRSKSRTYWIRLAQ